MLGYGQDREGPLGVRASSYEVTSQQVRMGSGTAGESFEGQHGCGSRLAGQAAPEVRASAGRGAEVAVNFAGDVTLEAADDLFLGQAFLAAPFNVGAGRGVRAHPGDHDPPQGMIGLAVAAGVEPVAGALA